MTIKLDRARENALTVAIADELGRATVDYDRYLTLRRDHQLGSDELLPAEAAEKIYRYCGHGGLFTFVRNEVNTRLRSTHDFKSKSKEKPLRDYDDFSDALPAAKEIVARLKQLPYRYRLTALLPAELAQPLIAFVSAVKLSDDAVICAGNRLPDNFETTSANKRLDDDLFSDWFSESLDTSREIFPDRLYFTCTDVGYVSHSDKAPIVSNFHDRLRAILGAATALNFFDYAFGFPHEKKPFVMVHQEGDAREIVETHELSDDLWQHRASRSTKRFVEKSDDPAIAIRTVFDRLSIVFGNDEAARKLFTACIWLFRAKLAANPLDSLLQSTIAIEVLLGDKEIADIVGVSRLIGNRCAYLLGVSRKTRSEIIAEFTEIYNLRSAIVHSGKHKIDRKDREVSENCVNLCSRVIAKELELHHASAMADTALE